MSLIFFIGNDSYVCEKVHPGIDAHPEEIQIILLRTPHERMKGCAAASFITVHALPVVAWEKSVTARTADDLTGPPF